jgi:hypothetical protein
VLIATFPCGALERCGAFADERRTVAATQADGRFIVPGRVVRRERRGFWLWQAVRACDRGECCQRA